MYEEECSSGEEQQCNTVNEQQCQVSRGRRQESTVEEVGGDKFRRNSRTVKVPVGGNACACTLPFLGKISWTHCISCTQLSLHFLLEFGHNGAFFELLQ